MELWKDIENYEGFYQVSNLGRVRSLDIEATTYRGGIYIKKGRVLKQHSHNNGYNSVVLSKYGITNTKTVHSLVALSFLDNNYLDHGFVVDHIDNIKTNNILDNLRITTHRYNISKSKKGNSKFTGVHFCNTKKRYLANIQHDGSAVHLGSFKNELDAKKAYDNALYCVKNNLDIEIKKRKYSSATKWVYYHTKSKRWRVQVKGKYMGSFLTEDLAIKLSRSVY